MARLSEPTRGEKDESVGPPWKYDGMHQTIVGTKFRTQGRVTICQIAVCATDGVPLYYPMKTQADEFGEEMAELLNEVGVWLPDRRFR